MKCVPRGLVESSICAGNGDKKAMAFGSNVIISCGQICTLTSAVVAYDYILRSTIWPEALIYTLMELSYLVHIPFIFKATGPNPLGMYLGIGLRVK